MSKVNNFVRYPKKYYFFEINIKFGCSLQHAQTVFRNHILVDSSSFRLNLVVVTVNYILSQI